MWNVPTHECDVTITNGEAAVLSCDLSADASRLLTGDVEGSVKVWSLPHGILLQDLPLHWDFVNCVLYSPVSQYILSASDNGLIKVCIILYVLYIIVNSGMTMDSLKYMHVYVLYYIYYILYS